MMLCRTRHTRRCVLCRRAPVPLAGPTSWQALVSYGKSQKERRVLVFGSSSGTGWIAEALGAEWSDVRAERLDDQVYDSSVEFESWNDGMQKELKEPVGIFATFGVTDKPIDPPIGAGSTRPSTCQPPRPNRLGHPPFQHN
ncbi:hypothetical protein PR003_g30977 [Phytophthora rubi]|uniref:Uncharacterized protein n=1 Tax=Phytophthora rubi TaxID=129364 RepID=A0A6A3GYN2_9STRA|nr:hypothetical protein PR001_g29859 [Phytophthora rubi]KAE8962003.1 hypothetical protein PR002_g29729 [Phytophthora rubi]KAE9269989.1 hypothetical protein PR003_g30977 [Phytophthora rubi]